MECKKGNLELYKEYLTCLEWMYLKFGKFCKEISHKLAFQGYLILLPLLLSSQDFGNEVVINTSLVVLAHLLSQLAEIELNWSNSFAVLNQGISDLPPDVLTWPSLLASQSSEPIGIAVLIFSYFYCISSSREEVALPLLAPLIQFIKCLHSQSKAGCIAKELSAPLIKALWFSFAVII
ncbi:hypothetical protein J437_LFUL005241 [Ladona fulva]|uniref:Uncharacterized protein n=1 Tax=Ladona fulva TaxID=123851 RepID=A0A8K0P6F6_LADFU|nr:hypothetical protein J437_LFUL005241 [Ladona fulva]